MPPTEYRIIPLGDVCGTTNFLQFKHARRYRARRWPFFGPMEDRVEVAWRFVPRDMLGVVPVPSPDECPTTRQCQGYRSHVSDLGVMAWKGNLRQFPRRWPDIQDYFDMLKGQRDRYLARKAKELKETKIEYLSNPESTP